MIKENTEKRFTKSLRAVGADRMISGTAIVFNSESELLGGMFTEIITPEAVTAETLSSSDIFMLIEHDDDMLPLARSKKGNGSLAISINANGVDFSFEAKSVVSGDEALSAVRSGDIDSCSFAFTVAEGGETWFAKPDGTYLRTITKIEAIYDFSLVARPAYTDAVCRSLDKFKETEKRNEPEPAPEPAPAPAPEPAPEPAPAPVISDQELNTYYNELEAGITEN